MMRKHETLKIAEIIGRLEVIQFAISNGESETANLDHEIEMLCSLIGYKRECET